MSGAEIGIIAMAAANAVIAALPSIVISIALNLVVSLLTGKPSASNSTTINGHRMSDTGVPSSGYTIPIPEVFGAETRIIGALIWANQIREVQAVEVATQTSGGGKSGSSTTTSTTTSFSYFGDFAIMFCKGPINAFTKLKANGKFLSADFIANYCTLYLGTVSQEIDVTISDSLGISSSPAYRGRAYIVFKNVPLEDFQNRIPEVSAFVQSPITTVGGMIDSLMARIPYVGYSVESALGSLSIIGASINELSPIKAGLQVLSMTYGFIITESDGILKFITGRSG